MTQETFDRLIDHMFPKAKIEIHPNIKSVLVDHPEWTGWFFATVLTERHKWKISCCDDVFTVTIILRGSKRCRATGQSSPDKRTAFKSAMDAMELVMESDYDERIRDIERLGG